MSTHDPWTEDRARRSREDWLPALAALREAELAEAVVPLLREQGLELEHQSLPEDGLGLLTIRDGALGQPFYLGEFPVATAQVTLRSPDGARYEGAAQHLGDSVGKAVHMAVCDALLAHAVAAAAPQVQALVARGQRRLHDRSRERGAMLERTRVDFDLLHGSDGGTDGD